MEGIAPFTRARLGASGKQHTLKHTYQGAEFDEKFLAHVISSHKDCITALEKNERGPKNAELKTWTDKVLVTLTTAETLTAK